MSRIIENRPTVELQQHPLQQKLFPYNPPAETQRVTATLQERGHYIPLEILPDGTVLTEYPTFSAAQTLGIPQLLCIVRDDLLTQGEKAVADRLINYNRNRPEIGPLAVVRACAHQLGIPASQNWDEFRKMLVEKLRVSPRNALRYKRIALSTPAVVQAAFEAGHLSLIDADMVASRGRGTKDEIAIRVAAGEDVERVVKELIAEERQPVNRTTRQRRLEKLGRCVDEIRRWFSLSLTPTPHELTVYRHFAKFFSEITREAQSEEEETR